MSHQANPVLDKEFKKWCQKSVSKFGSYRDHVRSRKHSNTPMDEKIVTDILAELAVTLNKKTALERENAELKLEMQAIKEENQEVEKMQEYKINECVEELKEEVQKNELNLININKNLLQKQKEFVEEIKFLKLKGAKDEAEHSQTVRELNKNINRLELQLKDAKSNYSLAKFECEENLGKTSKYKSKLKYAVRIINELNSLVEKYSNRPGLITRASQTTNETFESTDEESMSANTQTKTSCNENLLLSDIFFKSISFCENELLLLKNVEGSNFKVK